MYSMEREQLQCFISN